MIETAVFATPNEGRFAVHSVQTPAWVTNLKARIGVRWTRISGTMN
jgi:hypothetical protein